MRYVQPLLARHVERLRDDPALQQVDPVTGLSYEWNFLATHADLGLNLSKGSPTILVGVVDTGVTPGPDLAGKIAETWYDDALKSADDVDGHGTAVSSIIAAPADDGIGIAGFGGGARIVMYRDLRLNGVSDAVINLSFGGPGLSLPEADAINYAAKAGVLVVAAAGNRGTDTVDYPAAYLQDNGGVSSLGLAVGASNANGSRASFSNFGNHLSLVAPGAFADGDCQHGDYAPLPPVARMFDGTCGLVFTNQTTGARYAYMRGTSFATPEVAGAAALLWAARPDLKSYDIAKFLEQGTAQAPHGWLYTLGWGVLDVAHSLELETGLSAADSIQMGDISLAEAAQGGGAERRLHGSRRGTAAESDERELRRTGALHMVGPDERRELDAVDADHGQRSVDGLDRNAVGGTAGQGRDSTGGGGDRERRALGRDGRAEVPRRRRDRFGARRDLRAA